MFSKFLITLIAIFPAIKKVLSAGGQAGRHISTVGVVKLARTRSVSTVWIPVFYYEARNAR